MPLYKAGRPSGAEAYLRGAPSEKYPVGKVAGTHAHSYDGSSVMHRLLLNPVTKKYHLACAPAKEGVYSYKGFRSAVKCPKCRKMKTDGDIELIAELAATAEKAQTRTTRVQNVARDRSAV